MEQEIETPRHRAHLMAERRVLIKYADEVEAIRTDLMNRLTSHEQKGGWNA